MVHESGTSPHRIELGRTPKRKPPYRGVTVQSVYVPMRDGVNIAVDVIRPKGVADDVRLPTILFIARYWRSFALRGIAPPNRAPFGPRAPLPDFLVANGYAVVLVDTRGSGASGGSTPIPFNPEEVRDYGEVVEWIIRQPWSDGQVGATGISYEGIAAELLAAAHPTATRAVVPQQADIDQYAEFIFPGGILNEASLNLWQQSNSYLDRNQVPSRWGRLARLQLKGVRPVDGDKGGVLLKHSVAEHAANADVFAACKEIAYRDDVFGSSGLTLDDISSIRHKDDIERSGVAEFCWGSWLDGCTADGVIRRFATFSNPQWGVIGAWSHHYLNHGSPYTSPGAKLHPGRNELWQEVLQYFDAFLKGSDGEAYAGRKLLYYTMGEEAWKMTEVWPPDGVHTERWYLAADNALTPDAPIDAVAFDQYTVDFKATTGVTNRWWTQDGVTKVIYGDRSEADRRLLTYTSKILTEDIEITGHPVITLYVASTETDGAFYAYLEDVDEAGRVVYLTEGLLRALHRRVTAESSPTNPFVPHHSFLRSDGLPLVPGEVTEMKFGLLPVSALIRKGHRIRVAIAGNDSDTFTRIPVEGDPVITVHHSATYPSHLELPIMRK